MHEKRKTIRRQLKECSVEEYEAITAAANLSIEQKTMLDLFIRGRHSIVAIALRRSCCESLVHLRLAQAYDKIAKNLKFEV